MKVNMPMKIVHGINAFSKKEGDVLSLLIFPLLVVVVYEVVMRYVFNAPTIWGFEVTTFLYGIHYMVGLAYTDRLDGHVRVDVFTSRLSPKVQAIFGIITTSVIFLPVFFCLTIWSFKFAFTSVQRFERSWTSWAPPIYPFKIIMALAFLFLLLQGISNLIRYIHIAFGKTVQKQGGESV
jgi:TRAP-type mannitol/chloroaromatic compound transport system permease small subunit